MENGRALGEEKEFRENISKKDKIIDELKKDLESFKKERIVLLEDSEKLYKLYHLGVIDNKGDPLPFDPKDITDMN